MNATAAQSVSIDVSSLLCMLLFIVFKCHSLGLCACCLRKVLFLNVADGFGAEVLSHCTSVLVPVMVSLMYT